MQRVSIESRALRSIGYEAGAECLEVEFRDHLVYRYNGVPESVWASFVQSSSKGQHFNQAIRQTYPAMLVEVEKNV